MILDDSSSCSQTFETKTEQSELKLFVLFRAMPRLPNEARLAIVVWSLEPPYDPILLGPGVLSIQIVRKLKKELNVDTTRNTLRKPEAP